MGTSDERILERWECERGDSNPQAFRRQILSLVRLPVSPLSRKFGVPKKITPIPRTLEECGSASAGSSGWVYGAVIVNVMPIVYVPGLSVSQWTTGRKYTSVDGVPDPGEPLSIVASVVDSAVETPDGVRLQ